MGKESIKNVCEPFSLELVRKALEDLGNKGEYSRLYDDCVQSGILLTSFNPDTKSIQPMSRKEFVGLCVYDAERKLHIVPPVCTIEELDGKDKKTYEHFEDAPIVKHNGIKMFCKRAFNRLFFGMNCKDYGGERYNKDE